jgi:hypothetical protein
VIGERSKSARIIVAVKSSNCICHSLPSGGMISQIRFTVGKLQSEMFRFHVTRWDTPLIREITTCLPIAIFYSQLY